MYPMVRSRFIAFNKQFEGRMHWMYLDTHDPPLVTIGVGNLIDPVSEATKLPFRWKATTKRFGVAVALDDFFAGSGKVIALPSLTRRATKTEIEAEWKLIKSKTAYSKYAVSIWDTFTNLELDDAAIDDLCYERLKDNETILRGVFSKFESWPADAQLALLSMSWAMGAGFCRQAKWSQFSAACKQPDFYCAADYCHMKDTNNPGLVPRNRANKILFTNAAIVKAVPGRHVASFLNYPQVLVS